MPHHEYFRPTSLEEAHDLFEQHDGACFVAGGTDLFVKMQKPHGPAPSALISLRNIRQLSAMSLGDPFRIGTSLPISVIAEQAAMCETFPALVDAINVLGSPQIQNVATLGGNLCNASPAADTAPPLMIYDAILEVARGSQDFRKIPINEFFKGPGKTALEPGEILSGILINPPSPKARSAFIRKGRIKMDLATVVLSALVEMDGTTCKKARVAVGSVAPTPLRLPNVEAQLEGSDLSDDVIAAAKETLMSEIAPITDLRSTEEYRRDLAGVFFSRTITNLRGQQ